MIARPICLLKGHAYSGKLVRDTGYVLVSFDTCDRCGAGEDDLAFARLQSALFDTGGAA